MKQLALAVSLPDHAIFDTFVAHGNEALVQQCRMLAKDSSIGETLFISGLENSGKTHLLQAMCHACPADVQAVYLDLDNPDFPPDILQGWEQVQLLCLDNIDRIQGQADWEEALFDLFNRRLERAPGKRASLVMTAARPLADLRLDLADLRSRLSSGLIHALAVLADEYLSEALLLHARQRGLEIPKETLEFILKRLPRELGSLMNWLELADQAALEAQRKLTVPFVRKLISEVN
ncbi:MAG: DnaA regulatory inactivator Hda [Gammaproteobacteria bacterium]|nr:DnaA regulatory inactivator Hda [Gammaproteobacteria bacterium]NNC96737.1 DnaA regulatory inactivator Hda [Gammaproteobacteria bacterium]NNM13975.1 DnaA regulatory inactivator Hda [Gammaproteobacteria bacterium]